MSTDYSDVEFRAALLKTCSMGMNSDTWDSFCFLFGIPEGVREKTRRDVLEHLIKKGKICREKPLEFSNYLRQSLERNDLADKFLGLLHGRGDVEARDSGERTRQARADNRRHGMHLRYSQVPEFFCRGVDEDEEEKEEDSGLILRDKAMRYGPRRHDSTLSSRSSGYFSVTSRISITSFDADELQTVPTVQEASDETRKTGAALARQESIPRSSSYQSLSSSSASEEDCHSGLSSSYTSLSTIDSLPRHFSILDPFHPNFSTDPIYMDPPTSLTPTSERRKRESSPAEVVVHSPTHTSVKKTDTMILKCREIISDIDGKLKQKVYQNISSPGHGIDFKMKFYPIDHNETCCALFIKVTSHLRKKVIPPLDITVSILETSNGTARDISLSDDNVRCLARDQRTSKGNLVIQGQFTALFNKILDHQSLKKVSSEFLAVQVTMDYSNHHQPSSSLDSY